MNALRNIAYAILTVVGYAALALTVPGMVIFWLADVLRERLGGAR